MDWNVSIINKLNEINNKILLQNIERRKQINSIIFNIENANGERQYKFQASDNVVISAININNSQEAVEITLNGQLIISSQQERITVNAAALSLNTLTIRCNNNYSIEVEVTGTEILLK